VDMLFMEDSRFLLRKVNWEDSTGSRSVDGWFGSGREMVGPQPGRWLEVYTAIMGPSSRHRLPCAI